MRITPKLITLIEICIFLSSCGNTDKIEILQLMAEESIECSEDILSVQDAMTWGDSAIMLFTISDVPFGKIVNTNDGSIITSFGRKGEGPGENVWPRLMAGNAETGTIGIVDMSLGKVTLVTPHDSVRPTDYNVALFGLANQGIILNDTTFILHYMGEDKRFAMISKSELINDTIIPYPGGDDVTAMQAALIFQGRLLKHPTEDKFVHFSKYGKVIELFEFSEPEGKINRYAQAIEYLPLYWINGEKEDAVSGSLRDENKIGFVDGCATADAIYLLFSGRQMNDSEKYEHLTTVEVYDWNGQLTKLYELDTPIRAFVVNGDKLIGICEKGDRYYLNIYPLSK